MHLKKRMQNVFALQIIWNVFISSVRLVFSVSKSFKGSFENFIFLLYFFSPDWNWMVNSGTTHVSYVIFANHQSLPRNSSNTRAPRFVARVSTNNSPNDATNVKRCYARAEWRVGAPSFTVIASNVKYATQVSLINLSNRRTPNGTVCLAINTSTLRSVPDAIAISSMANITLWMRTAGTRNVSAARYAGTCSNNKVSCRRMGKLSWFVKVAFECCHSWFWGLRRCRLFMRCLPNANLWIECNLKGGYCCCCQSAQKLTTPHLIELHVSTCSFVWHFSSKTKENSKWKRLHREGGCSRMSYELLSLMD